MAEKEQAFASIGKDIEQNGLKVISVDQSRPWGGFFVINEAQTPLFTELCFPGFALTPEQISHRLSPKILVVAPHQRLSWQYHLRRAELWRVLTGPVTVVRSKTDTEQNPERFNAGDVIDLAPGQRHRLVGLDNWGIIAEIWEHTDPANPSDEDDIVRLQDDFGRAS